MTLLTIDRVAAGGDGVGRLDNGMAVFVPRTAPGDVIEVEVVERRRRYARGRVRRLVTPGPDRAAPPCAHYRDDRCGGCQLQHMSADGQLHVKRRIVGDALRRIGHRDVADPEIVPSPREWRYRTKITLAAKGGALGLHPYDQPERVFDLADCPITGERIVELWRRLRRHRDLLPAPLLSVVLREDREGGLHVVVSDGAGRAWDAAPLARAVGAPDVCIWWLPHRGAARVLAGPAPAFPVLAFEQSNPELAARMRRDAVAALAPVECQVVWDLYGGVGDTAALLAGLGGRVWSVDADRSAVEWAQERLARERGVDAALTFVVGRAEESLHRLPEPDAVVVNPPRAGLAPRVSAWLERWASGRSGARLAYVSCDPATLARDLARMSSLRLGSVTAYDLFPQTAHVETLAVLASR